MVEGKRPSTRAFSLIMQENKKLLKYVDSFFSPLVNGFCTFYEKESGSRTVFIKFLNVKNLDLKKLKTISI